MWHGPARGGAPAAVRLAAGTSPHRLRVVTITTTITVAAAAALAGMRREPSPFQPKDRTARRTSWVGSHSGARCGGLAAGSSFGWSSAANGSSGGANLIGISNTGGTHNGGGAWRAQPGHA